MNIITPKHFRLKTSRHRKFCTHFFAVPFAFSLIYLLSALFFPTLPSHAETSTASASTPAGTVSMANESEVKLEIHPSSSPRTHLVRTKLKIESSCKKGAIITLSTNKDHNNLERKYIVNSDTGTKVIPATETNAPELTNYSWGYSSDGGYRYSPVPRKTDNPAKIYESYSAGTEEKEIYYGVKTDRNLPSGYYSTELLYTVVIKPECIKYNLKFDLNQGVGKTGQSYDDQRIEYDAKINLTNYTPTREGYLFDGWSAINTGTSNEVANFTGNETDVNVNPNRDLDITLKAKWKEVPSMTTFKCSTLSEHQIMKLKDPRDGNIYTVAKLKDGRCWMTENLRIMNKTITPADSDVTTNYTIPASSKNGFDAQNISNVYVDPAYGGYYSWHAATAGTGTTVLATDGQRAPSSICPRGWRLPTGRNNGEFKTMSAYYNSVSSLQSAPTKFVSSGLLFHSQTQKQGTEGWYWSSSAYSNNGAYSFGYTASAIYTEYSDSSKSAGFAVRCIADDDRTIFNISTMQSMTSKICEKATTPLKTATQLDTDGSHHGDPNYVPTKTLTDIRDNNTYTVSKLADGKCWMTKNLSIAGKTITPADSDVASNYTIPASSISGFTSYDTSNAYVNSDGGFYSWYTATAGTGTQSLSTNGYNTTVSICPKGWRLPTSGNGNSDFNILYNNYNSSSALRSAPMNLTLSGYASSSSMYDQGSGGYYWSSTVYSFSNAYSLYLNSSGVTPSDYSTKFYGFSVRCVAR